MLSEILILGFEDAEIVYQAESAVWTHGEQILSVVLIKSTYTSLQNSLMF
jgi:hypothetical protein